MLKLNKCSYEYDDSLPKKVNAANARMGGWSVSNNIQDVLENSIHSIHRLNDGGTKSDDCIETYGIIIDIDNDDWKNKGLTELKDIKRLLTGVNHFIYSSLNYKRVKPDKKADGAVARYHIFIPFKEILKYENDTDISMWENVFLYFESLFGNRMDTQCKDRARLIFSSNGNTKVFEEIPGDLFDWEKINFSNIEPHISSVKLTNDRVFTLDTIVDIAKGAKAPLKKGEAWRPIKHTKVRDIYEKTPIFCPFCHKHDIKSGSASGWVGFDCYGIPFIKCSHCESVDNITMYRLNKKETQLLRNKGNGLIAFHAFGELPLYLRLPGGAVGTVSEKACITEFSKRGLKAPTNPNIFKMVKDYSSDELIINCNDNDGIDTINLYKAPDVLKIEADNKITTISFPTIWSLLCHLIPLDAERAYFLEWLSEVVRRKRMRTTWVVIGQPGSGKNIFFEEVVGNIVGKTHVSKIGNALLKKEFNTFLSEGVFYIFNEIAVNKNDRTNIKEKIKEIVTDTFIPIEGKGMNAKQHIKMSGNCVFLSNSDVPIEIESNDRRFNVIRTSPDLICNLSWYKPDLEPVILKELPAFVAYLKAIVVIHDVCNLPLHNIDKQKMQDAILTRSQRFWKYLHECDGEKMWELQEYIELGWNRKEIDINTCTIDMETWKKSGFIERDDIKTLLNQVFVDYKKARISLTESNNYFTKSTQNCPIQQSVKRHGFSYN